MGWRGTSFRGRTDVGPAEQVAIRFRQGRLADSVQHLGLLSTTEDFAPCLSRVWDIATGSVQLESTLAVLDAHAPAIHANNAMSAWSGTSLPHCRRRRP